MPLRITLWCAVLLAACGGSDASLPDAGSDARGVAPPLPPEPPVAVAWDACPDGWRRHEVGDARVCEPWAGDAAPECASTELALPGRGCVPVDACPADGWPVDLPPGALHVRPGAVGGNGSRERPFGTIREAVRAANATSVLALAVGEHEGGLDLRVAEVRGACATGTTVRDPVGSSSTAAIGVLSPRMRVSGVRLVSAYRGLWIGQASAVEGEALILEAPYGGLHLDPQASFVGTRVRVEGTPPTASLPGGLVAVGARLGGSVHLTDSTVLRGAQSAIQGLVFRGEPDAASIRVTLERSSVLDTPIGVFGYVNELVLRDVAVERFGVGVVVPNACTATLSRVSVRDGDVARSPSGSGFTDSWALATLGGTAVADQLYASRMRGAVVAASAGTLRARRLVVDGLRHPNAVGSTESGTIEVEQAHFAQVAGTVMHAESGATVVARDVVVDGVTALDDLTGDVVAATGGARMTLERARVRGVQRALAVVTTGGSLEARSVDVEGGFGTVAHCLAEPGWECPAGMPSALVLGQVRMRSMQRFGVSLIGGARGTLRDVDVDGVAGGIGDGAGYGVFVDGQCEAERLRLRGTSGRALLVLKPATVATLADVLIDGVAPAECPTEPCIGGEGLTCGEGARAHVTSFAIVSAERAGLALAAGCVELALTRGVITENTIGVLSDRSIGQTELQVADVRIEGNETDINTTDLAVSPPDIDLRTR
jgi:hypothetical protein